MLLASLLFLTAALAGVPSVINTLFTSDSSGSGVLPFSALVFQFSLVLLSVLLLLLLLLRRP
jgi:hypothetical protein